MDVDHLLCLLFTDRSGVGSVGTRGKSMAEGAAYESTPSGSTKIGWFPNDTDLSEMTDFPLGVFPLGI